jgi:hypothetical protein
MTVSGAMTNNKFSIENENSPDFLSAKTALPTARGTDSKSRQ